MIIINQRLSIPENEIRFTFSCSGGPGGQNVNKVNTRATLWFDVSGSQSLDPFQKDRIRMKLATRINKKGVLHVTSFRHRTQAANRSAAMEHFAELLNQALIRKPPRKRTRVPQKSRERRLSDKKHRGRVKQQRAPVKKWPS